MKSKYLVVLLFSIAATLQSFCQPVFIIGNVVAEGNEAIASASIILKQSGQKTKSKNDGSFSLQYNGNADTLLITHIGFKTMRIPVNTSTLFPLQIILYKVESVLEEVVVNTGYQQLPKERATGSFTQIDNATFNQQVSSDIMSRLPAIANGLSEGRKTNSGNFSAPGKILIRGLSTINGPSSPLIILDNFPYEGDLQNINPNDVESITLLKDAAAASIWGARAGNGVIVITTKKGKFNQKIKVEFNSNLKITQKPDLFYAKTISSGDLIDVEEFLFSKGYRFSDTASSSHPPFSPVYEILFKQRSGKISAAEAASQINVLRNHDVRDDFNKYIYNPAVSQQYAVNIRGGSNNVAWLLSGGVDKNLDVLSAGYNRINFRSENNVKLSRLLQLNTSFYFIGSENKSGKEGYTNINPKFGTLPTYTQLVDPKGYPVPLAKEYRKIYTDTAGIGKLLSWDYFPFEDYKHATTTTKIQDITGSISLSYEILKGLTANVKYLYERQTLTGKDLNDIESYYARSLINSFYQPAAANNFPVPIGGILTSTNRSITSHNARGQLNFNKTWKNHEIVVIGGTEIRQVLTEGNSNRIYGYDDNILTKIPVDYVNSYKSYITGSSIRIPFSGDLSEKINRFVSFFGNAAYTHQQKYTFSLSGRRDASNIFGVNTNDKWNPLWSAGARWIVSNERFYHSSLLPRLSLRATYGISGNIDPSLSAVTTLSYGATSPYTLLPYAKIAKFYNPDLRWEKNKQLNLGIDFSSKNSRVTGSIDYYIKNGIDLYGPSLLDYTVGLGIRSIQKNAANMQAKGIDIEIHSLIINRKIRWSSDINLSLYHDKVTSYYLSSAVGSNFINNGLGISGIVGKPVNSVLSFSWAGLDPLTGDPQGYLNGKVSKDYSSITSSGTSISELAYSGPGMPTGFGSVGNTLSYKGFSIAARITYKFGYYFKRQSLDYSSLFSSLNGTSDFARRWQKPGDEKFTNVPSMVYPAISSRDAFYYSSEALIEKGDHIRLQYITLSYNFLKLGFQKLAFENARLYVNANDLGIIWRANKNGLDPDYTNGSIPPSKNIAVGIQINF